MSEDNQKIDVHRGLAGVYFERSRVCYIDGRAGELRYRGYSIHDLAERSTFEETFYLLLKGELPGKDELARFDADLKAERKLPPEINKLIEITKIAHPMDVLRTAVSALAAFDPDVADNSPQAIVRKGVRLASQVPMIVAAHEHIRNSRAPVAPDPALGHAANFLYMLKGAAPS
ncbi:MAG: citrate (Si)-synthase, partial [Pseudomonadota bacterium]|nr:citrate (Si)-synthase [Pseudomonadota bacterium]